MVLSVDLKRLNNHILLLQEELSKAEELEKRLVVWQNTMPTAFIVQKGLLQKQILLVQNEKECIRARIKWIEDAVPKLKQAKHLASEQLTDAFEILNKLD